MVRRMNQVKLTVLGMGLMVKLDSFISNDHDVSLFWNVIQTI